MKEIKLSLKNIKIISFPAWSMSYTLDTPTTIEPYTIAGEQYIDLPKTYHIGRIKRIESDGKGTCFVELFN